MEQIFEEDLIYFAEKYKKDKSITTLFQIQSLVESFIINAERR